MATSSVSKKYIYKMLSFFCTTQAFPHRSFNDAKATISDSFRPAALISGKSHELPQRINSLLILSPFGGISFACDTESLVWTAKGNRVILRLKIQGAARESGNRFPRIIAPGQIDMVQDRSG